MSKVINLTGQRFGRLTVIKRFPNDKNNSATWLCKCDCGNTKIVRGIDLTRGMTKSCGCFRHEFRTQDFTGMRFGKLTVLRKITTNGGHGTLWECQCDCGNIVSVRHDSLKTGHTSSCGCYNKSGKSHIRHGKTNTRIHRIWNAMKQRCTNPNCKAWKNYGGREITICDEWNGKDGFENFYEWSSLHGYTDELTIDRIDVNGNYCPENCRWVTRKEQQNNRRANVVITYNNEKHTLTEWADILGVNSATLINRHRLGWNDIDIITKPIKNQKR